MQKENASYVTFDEILIRAIAILTSFNNNKQEYNKCDAYDNAKKHPKNPEDFTPSPIDIALNLETVEKSLSNQVNSECPMVL